MGNTQSTSTSGPGAESDALVENNTTQRRLNRLSYASTPETTHTSTPRGRRQRFSLYGSLRRTSHHPPANQSNPSLQALNQDVETEQEDRPLVPSEGRMSGSIEDGGAGIVPNPLLRSASSVSRLGSRFLPDTVARVLLSSGEETPAEGHALRNGNLDPGWRSPPASQSYDTQRFSILDSIRRRAEQRSDSRSENRRHIIRGAFPGNAGHQQLHNDLDAAQDLEDRLNSELQTFDTPVTSRTRRRLQRVRASLSNPLISLFQSSTSRRTSPAFAGASPRVTFPDDNDRLLPITANGFTQMDMGSQAHELDAVESETRTTFPRSASSAGISAIRRLPSTFRSRSRLYRRQENPPLSQVLQLAAQAIATQLSTHSVGGTPTTRPVVGDTFGGSIEDFVHTLQEAASAQAGEHLDVNTPEGELPPVNFMRVFQFPNDENGQPLGPGVATNPEAVTNENQTLTTNPDRSVTLVLVGVRSMPPTHDAFAGAAFGPSLDNVLNLPSLTSDGGLGNPSPGAVLRRTSRARVRPRRHSMTNFDFPAQYESQRHHRPRVSSVGQPSEAYSSITPISESPPGPHPPPSTPADIRSGQATPIRRPSSASAAHAAALPDLDEDRPQNASLANLQPEYSAARQRVRSDSEFARRPELGAGAIRRNGVVEPDHVPTGTGRSWLIYVVGTNVSPDHPAFTMPSLFTDNPSYEDMQMLTTLLGPVKPPVATQEDVTSSGGLYRVTSRDGGLLAEPLTDGQHAPIELRQGERCLICLCDYEANTEVRQLNKCQHVYHRECIDEWLTTGRNNCPMCRGQGVEERPTNNTGSPDEMDVNSDGAGISAF
ncbi:putative RING finger protein [Cyphellophora attinorum]|uniref:Putative RING finger protein n=1 Tax=Cyphellophora attinorum TaxID=1664694 RepID=A0A0N0NPS7_9EURO|nr:putative RING finger protein [Phialophora attinorum]KPI42889.1 putative RING finger protein [Phialophora attinorum]